MPLCTGGDLKRLMENYPEALNASFIWHINLNIFEALLFLQYGITRTQTSPVDGWKPVFHGDLHAGNVLMQPFGQTSFGNFPSIVLSDFGEARQFPGYSQLRTGMEREKYTAHQYGDVLDVGRLTEEILELTHDSGHRLDDAAEIALLDWIGDLEVDVVAAHMQKMAVIAWHQRDHQYEHLPTSVLRYLCQDVVSDAELEDVFLS